MKLDPNIAKTIVENLKEVVNHEINLIDIGGTIIASTDTKRIGTLHKGALKVVMEKRTIIVQSDNEFDGTKSGINLPVNFDEGIVAVVGITGDPDLVAPLGRIIQKMTEILIWENAAQLMRFNKQNHYNELVNMLISKEKDENLLSYMLSVLNVSRDIPRRAVIAEFLPTESDSSDLVFPYEQMVPLLNNQLKSSENSIFSSSNQRLCILFAEKDTVNTVEYFKILKKEIEQQLHRTIVFGMGRVVEKADDIWLSAKEAEVVVNWELFSKNTQPLAYESLDIIQLLTANLPVNIGEQYITKIFNDLSEEDIEDFQEIFMAYIKYNGSISKGAEELYIHKNTFQNHLNKIYEKTGYNPRNLNDSPVLYFAFHLRNYLKFIDKQA